jgi:hypothetical protein
VVLFVSPSGVAETMPPRWAGSVSGKASWRRPSGGSPPPSDSSRARWSPRTSATSSSVRRGSRTRSPPTRARQDGKSGARARLDALAGAGGATGSMSRARAKLQARRTLAAAAAAPADAGPELELVLAADGAVAQARTRRGVPVPAGREALRPARHEIPFPDPAVPFLIVNAPGGAPGEPCGGPRRRALTARSGLRHTERAEPLHGRVPSRAPEVSGDRPPAAWTGRRRAWQSRSGDARALRGRGAALHPS